MNIPQEQVSSDHAAILQVMTNQLLIILFKRLGAMKKSVVVSISEIDNIGHLVLDLRLVDCPEDSTGKGFEFSVRRKMGGDGASI